MNKEYIFNITREDYKYKGVLFSEADNEKVSKMMGGMPPPRNYVAGIMGIIYVDEKGIWYGKMRIKFPSGNRQIITKNYEEEFKKGINVNETYVLQDLYKLPMVNKKWYPNKSETPNGILDILSKTDMIESYRIISGEFDANS